MIKINKIVEPVCKLFGPDDEFIGEISSLFSLNDVRIQIMRQKLEGYYIVTSENQRVSIGPCGRLSDWPNGFYDLISNQLDILLDCK